MYLQFNEDQEQIKSDFCGFESGQDWLDDLAIENYLLGKGTHESETKNIQPDTLKRDLRRINL